MAPMTVEYSTTTLKNSGSNSDNLSSSVPLSSNGINSPPSQAQTPTTPSLATSPSSSASILLRSLPNSNSFINRANSLTTSVDDLFDKLNEQWSLFVNKMSALKAYRL